MAHGSNSGDGAKGAGRDSWIRCLCVPQHRQRRGVHYQQMSCVRRTQPTGKGCAGAAVPWDQSKCPASTSHPSPLQGTSVTPRTTCIPLTVDLLPWGPPIRGNDHRRWKCGLLQVDVSLTAPATSTPSHQSGPGSRWGASACVTFCVLNTVSS